MLNRDVNLQEILRRILGGWYWVALFAVIGGTIGFLISMAKAPQYQAAATMDIGYDFSRMVPLNDSYQRRAYYRVRDLILSDDVLRGAVILLDDDNYDKSLDDLSELRTHLRLADYNDHWEFIVFLEDPSDAAAFANAWSESTVSELEAAVLHSWRVTQLQSDFFDLGCVFDAEAYEGEPAAVWICQHEDVELDPDLLVEELVEEIQLSRGILPALSFSILSEAAPPVEPVLWDRGVLIIASTVVGLILGIIFAMTRPVIYEDREVPDETQTEQDNSGE
jgi:capsular polysaccharide biosynthesis protein